MMRQFVKQLLRLNSDDRPARLDMHFDEVAAIS